MEAVYPHFPGTMVSFESFVLVVHDTLVVVPFQKEEA